MKPNNLPYLLLKIAIGVVAVLLVSSLYLFSQTFNFWGVTYERWSIAVFTIILLLLNLMRYPVQQKRMSWDVFRSHEATVLFSTLLIIYLSNNMLPNASDSITLRYLPFSILRERDFDLDEFKPLLSNPPSHGILFPRSGHAVSGYPVGAPILATPFYVPSALGPESQPTGKPLREVEKLAIASIVALSAVLLYFTLRMLTDTRTSLILAFLYGLGTSSFSEISQDLLQHGPSTLALAATFYCLLRARTEPVWAALAGLPLGFAPVCRPTDAVIVAPLALYVLFYHRRHFPGFLLLTLPAVTFQLLYNYIYFLNPFRTQLSLTRIWRTPFLEGFTGILFSPSHGLFVYSPFLLFSVIGMFLVWRKKNEAFLRFLSIGVILNIVVYSRYFVWWGGDCFGPRLLSDLSPALILFLYPLRDYAKNFPVAKGLFVALAFLSVLTHFIGAFRLDPRYLDRRKTPRQVVSRPHFDSQSTPKKLAAKYSANPSNFVDVEVGQPMRFTFTAENRGDAVWLSQPQDGTGDVYLEWAWYQGKNLVAGVSGQSPIYSDVSPGEEYKFQISLDAPTLPGDYTLQMGLVSDGITRFSDVGSPDWRARIQLDWPDPAKLWDVNEYPILYHAKRLLGIGN